MFNIKCSLILNFPQFETDHSRMRDLEFGAKRLKHCWFHTTKW